MSEKSKRWVKAAGIRALKTFCQVMGGGITVGAAINEINWTYLVSVAIVSSIGSIFTSLAGLPEVDD